MASNLVWDGVCLGDLGIVKWNLNIYELNVDL